MLEVGPGLGVLTRYLAERVAQVHAAEVDRRLEPDLAGIREPTALGRRGAPRHRGARTAAAKLVANLPYNVATPIVAESLVLGQLERWCVMVQREVADRSSRSVDEGVRRRLGARAARDRAHRPPPGLPRGLPPAPERRVRARRIPAHRPRRERVKRVVEAAFAHRRKTLANSLSLGGVSTREQAVAALDAIGREPNVRAEALAPPEFVALPRRSRRDRPGSREDQPRARRRAGARRRQARARDRLPAPRPRRPHPVEPAPSTTVDGLSRGHDRARALDALDAPHGWRVRIEKHMPVAAGLGGGSSDAATALRLANAQLDDPLGRAELHELAARARGGHPVLPRRRPAARSGDGTVLSRSSCPGLRGPLAPPARCVEALDASVYAAFDARDGAAGYDERADRLETALAAVRRPRDLAALPSNDLASSPLADELVARRVSRRRQRRRAGRVRALRAAAARATRAAASLQGSERLGDDSSVVRLNARCSVRTDRAWLEPSGALVARRRLRVTFWIAAVEGLLYVLHVLHWWEAVALAALGVARLVVRGPDNRLRPRAAGQLDLRGVAAARPLRPDRARARQGGRDRDIAVLAIVGLVLLFTDVRS